ncbi:alpha-1-antitrypsin homolog isoform X2 [Neoarius graeffei]|uniref:alpha-1-antitrypsin homolog isoform X2 n=1 Tax=Neoarius graeffei TaxID=443677 RepID=UPI00298CA527|nr:alpha-1-antitrypsin homolog isoform X2 [Neoarius graeffei]
MLLGYVIEGPDGAVTQGTFLSHCCKMWRKIQWCLTFAFLLMVALADHQESHDGEHSAAHHLRHGVNEPPSRDNGEGKICSKILSKNADFAFTLYNKLSSHTGAKGKNIFFSPLSISLALSLLALGAKGETHSQIFSTLGYSSFTEDQVNEAYEHLLNTLDQSNEAALLEIGGGLAVRKGFKPLDKFLKDLQRFYNGEAFSVDFSKPEVAVQEVNKFIAKKTNDTITDILKSLDQDTILVLINYIYFRGKWEKPFDVERTHKADFHVDENTKVTVDMMQRTGRYDFYYDWTNFTSVIKLPYKGNTSILIVLPDEGKLEEVEKHLSKESLKYWQDKLFRSSVDLSLPKFSISASSSLENTLKELGIIDAFSDHADFSGISVETKLKATKVVHQAVLKVDERGTEAAGATTIEILPMSLPGILNLNRPFLVFIVDESTKSLLFVGKISNPTEQ